ncbi:MULTISPECIES: hypothetical protein [Galbibacter]|uniref:Uncharacterized protein n=1 Tax=Galbibacter pacificus TaxID=2996052 RepID=A0ABT6FRH7_9FLAO|nr:hypothetical protein [Galbibacter pacificus]MDG3581657.1 hypothetical protein [Galbibacter pacificus]MDG3585869.1 hypothetical protein [Galbibacter pacificus]
MARAMFEYTKTVLQKVSFDPKLFCRELEKAAKRLLPYELDELRIWLNFYIQGKPELSKCLIYFKQ